MASTTHGIKKKLEPNTRTDNNRYKEITTTRLYVLIKIYS